MGDRMSLVVLLSVVIVCCGSVRAIVFYPDTVGGSEGWVVPSGGDTDMYHRWASDKTFFVGDILLFRYKNDSVLVVSQKDYEKCYTANPIRAYYGRYAHYKLDWSGYHYFISGRSGHCELGQKMAIEVKSSEIDGFSPPPSCPPLNASCHGRTNLDLSFLDKYFRRRGRVRKLIYLIFVSIISLISHNLRL